MRCVNAVDAARWAQRSNAPPTMADLWVEPVASPSCLVRPRPQDFDPDPRVRRQRTPLPAKIRADPFSIPNILHALKAASLKARITRSGDPHYERGHIQIDMPVKGRSRFVAIAERDAQGRMVWRWVWDGNGSEAGGARHQRALRCNAYARMVEALRHGRRSVQADLILRLGLTPAHLPPANPGASAAAVGHPGKGKCDACLFLSTPARRLCRAGLACFRRLPC